MTVSWACALYTISNPQFDRLLVSIHNPRLISRLLGLVKLSFNVHSFFKIDHHKISRKPALNFKHIACVPIASSICWLMIFSIPSGCSSWLPSLGTKFLEIFNWKLLLVLWTWWHCFVCYRFWKNNDNDLVAAMQPLGSFIIISASQPSSPYIAEWYWLVSDICI